MNYVSFIVALANKAESTVGLLRDVLNLSSRQQAPSGSILPEGLLTEDEVMQLHHAFAKAPAQVLVPRVDACIESGNLYRGLETSLWQWSGMLALDRRPVRSGVRAHAPIGVCAAVSDRVMDREEARLTTCAHARKRRRCGHG
eukprot:6194973-Pleurochrysis_carterae.AAC.2